MSNLLKKNEKGFTLIEIVLVLAIAGLLLVIVFLAVSGAQKSRRDSQRKADNARIEAQLESFAGNNNGVYPNTAAFQTQFKAIYVNAINNPDGTPYATGAFTFVAGLVPSPQPVLAKDAVTIFVSGRTVTSCIGLEQGTACVGNQ